MTRKGETGDIGIDIVAEEEATGEFAGLKAREMPRSECEAFPPAFPALQRSFPATSNTVSHLTNT